MEGLRKTEQPMFVGTVTIEAHEYRDLIEEATMRRAQMDELDELHRKVARLELENRELKTELESEKKDKNDYYNWWHSELKEANKAKSDLSETEKKLNSYVEFVTSLGCMVNFEAWLKEKENGNKDND